MNKVVAIQRENYSSDPLKPDSSSSIWESELAKRGMDVKWVNVRDHDILDQLKGVDAFMWRWAHFQGMSRIARRLFPLIEKYIGIPTYPDWQTCWHYDDKILQSQIFQLTEIPSPSTFVFFDKNKALRWIDENFRDKMVLKLSAGAGSSNVQILHTKGQAIASAERHFKYRLFSLEDLEKKIGLKQRVRYALRLLKHGKPYLIRDDGYEVQSGYLLLQEFLEGNDYDTRVTVIGNRAFAFRRYNRAGDFRASGSGSISFDPNQIDLRFVKLAFEVTQKLNTSSCAIDGMYKCGTPVIGEISYTYASWAVAECPGHWVKESDDIKWIEGNMWPEEAQIEDFVAKLS